MINSKKIRKITVIILVLLLAAGQLFTSSTGIQAAGRKISLNTTKISLSVGQSRKLNVINLNGKSVKWSSSKKTVASVNKDGLVMAKKAGKAVITARVQGKKLRCNVVVSKTSVNTSSTPVPEATQTPVQEPAQEPAASAPAEPTQVPAQ